VAKNFKDLSEQEILALAISSEETDARVYADFAAALKADYPATSQIFEEMEATRMSIAAYWSRNTVTVLENTSR
jgi:rubrerythrin